MYKEPHKEMLDWLPPGRSKTAGPRVRWTEEIQNAMAETGLEGKWIDRKVNFNFIKPIASPSYTS
jgi:hypothetical protein